MHLVNILLSWAPLAAAIGYEGLLTQLSTNIMQTTHSTGDVSYSMAKLSLSMKRRDRGDSDMQKLHNALSRFPELNIHSIDNSRFLEAIRTAATEAYQASKYGDFFYLWQVMYHNGYPAQINNISNGELQREIAQKIPGIPNIAEMLANTLTIAGVANMYLGLPKKSARIFTRGDVTICTCDHLPNVLDCEQLISGLGEGVVFPRQRAWCHGECCASWNQGVTFYSFWAQRKANWCMTHCIYNGFSCKIENIWFYEKRVNFCTSSVAVCS